MSPLVTIHPTGFDDYIHEDRPALFATPGRGNTHHLEVFLTATTPDDEVFLGWFKVSDLQQIITAATESARAKEGN